MENNEKKMEMLTTDGYPYAEVQPAPVKKKKKLHADAFLLMVLSFVVLATLATFTFLKQGGAVLSGAEALEEEEAATMEYNTSTEGATITAEEVRASYDTMPDGLREYLQRNDEFLSHLDDALDVTVDDVTGLVTVTYYRPDGNGGYELDEHGDPIVDTFSNYYAPGSFIIVEFNPDEAFGLESDVKTPSQLDEVVQNTNPVQNKAAYADAYLYGNYWSVYAQDTWYYSSWGDAWGPYASCSNGGYCQSVITFYLSISDGVWNRWRSRGRYYTYNNYGYSSNWGGTCTSNNCYSNSSSGSYMQAVSYTYTPSDSCCTSYSAACQVHLWGNFGFAHNDYTDVSMGLGGINSWRPYIPNASFWATFYGNNNNWGSLIYRVDFEVAQDTGGGSWSGWFYDQNWNGRGAYDWYPWAEAVTTYNGGNCWSRAYWWWHEVNNHSGAGYWNADTLRIDWRVPEVRNWGFHLRTADYLGGGIVQQENNNSYMYDYAGNFSTTTTLYFSIGVQDITYDYAVCGVSGMSYVDLYRNGGYWGRMTNRGSYFTLGVQAQYCNAYWSVVAYDNAGNGVWLISNFWIDRVDCAAPTIGNCTVQYAQTKSDASYHWTVSSQGESQYWSSAIYRITCPVSDSVGQNYNSGYFFHCGISSVAIYFYIGSTRYGINASVDTSRGGWSYSTYSPTATFWLPQDYTMIRQTSGGAYGFIMYAYDYAGHTTQKNFGIEAFSVGGGKYIRMDTDAPNVSVSLNGGGSSWVNYAPTFTVTANDSSSTSGCSGTRAVYIYNTSSTLNSSPIATLTTSTCTNGGISGNTTWTWTLDRDSVQIANGGTAEPRLYFVAVDNAGNRSDSYNGYSAVEGNNRSWNGSSYSLGGVSTTYWTGSSANQTVYCDTYQPYMNFTITTTYTNNSTSSASFNSGTSWQVYTCKYDKGIKKINISFNTAFGSSGGSVRLEGSGSGTYSYVDYRQGKYSYSGKSTWASTGTGTATKTVSIDVTAQGTGTYSFTYTGNNGNKSYGRVITQIDNTAPDLTLKGFLPYTEAQQLGSNSTTNTNIINGLSSNMKATTFFDGKWTSKSWYALFQVGDSHSGITYIENGNTSRSNNSRSYGLNGGSTQNSVYVNSTTKLGQSSAAASYTVGGKTYTKTISMDIRRIGGNYYLQVPIYDISGITSGGTTLKDALVYGSPQIVYYVTIGDFVGNTTTKTVAVNYDPNDVEQVALTMFETEDTIENKNGTMYIGSQAMPTTSAAITTKLAGMSSVSTYTAGNWSKKKVVVRFAYKPSVSSPIVGLTNSSGTSIVGQSCTAYTVINNYETWYVFDANCRKLENLQITKKNQAFDYNGNGTAKITTKINNNSINIWQDNVGPNITGYFFSTSPNLPSIPANGDGNILLYFDVSYVNNAYKTTYNAAKSSRSDSSQWSSVGSGSTKAYYIWTGQNVYMYFVLNDKTTSMSGSGVKSVSSSNDSYNNVGAYTTTVATEKLYYSNQSYQYDSTKSYSITAYDNAGNASKTIQIGGKSTTGTILLTLPYVDTTGPFVKLVDCVYSTENENKVIVQKSYTHATTKQDDSAKVGAGQTASYVKNFNGDQGEYFGGSDVSIDLNAFSGKSGYRIFMRRRENNAAFTDLTSFNVGSAQMSGGVVTGYTPLSLPANYNFAANGWGQYIEGNFVQNGNPVATKGANPVDGTYNYNGTQTVSINADTVSGYFDFLIVTGVNTYYLIEAGKFMLDRGSPVYYKDMTIFAKNKQDLGDSVSYSTLSADMIWSTTVDEGYTNGNVDVYLCVDDSLSGVAGVYSDPGFATAMNVVTVTGMKLFVISGKTVKYRLTGTPTNYVASDHNGKFRITFNYVGNATKIIVDTDIEYSSNATLSYTTDNSVTYYRYKATESTSLSLYAQDNVGNKLLLGKSDLNIKVKIDFTALSSEKFKVNTTTIEYDDNGQPQVVEYQSNNDAVYSNQAVTVTVTSLFGDSGFGYLTLQEQSYYDEYNNKILTTPTVTNRSVYLPTMSNHNGVLRFSWQNASGTTVTSDVYSAASTAVSFPADGSLTLSVLKETVSGKTSYYWVVNGKKAVDSTGKALAAINETRYAFWVSQLSNGRTTSADVYYNSVYKIGSYTVTDSASRTVTLPSIVNNGGYLRISYKNTSGSTVTYDVYEKSTTSDAYYRMDAITDNAKIAIKNNCWYINDKKLFYLSGSNYLALPQPNSTTYGYFINHTDTAIRFYIGEDGLTYTVNGLNLPDMRRSSTGKILMDYRSNDNKMVSDVLLCNATGTLTDFPAYGNLNLSTSLSGGKYSLLVNGVVAYCVTEAGATPKQIFLSTKDYALLTSGQQNVKVQFATDDVNYKVTLTMKFNDTENGKKVNHKYVYTAQSYNGVAYDNNAQINGERQYPENHSAAEVYNIFMDTEAPTITLSSTDLTNWTKSEKLLNCTVKDSLSGLNILSDAYLKDVALEYTIKNQKYTYLMVDIGNNNGTFYPVNLQYNSVSAIAKNNTFSNYQYLTDKIQYTVIAVDKAGNRAEYDFTPNIDTTSAEMSNIQLYQINSDQTTAGSYTVDTWSSKAVKLVADVTYGESGYYVQTGTITTKDSKRCVLKWDTLDKGVDYLATNVSKNKDSIEIKFANTSVTAFYQNYAVRVISVAEYNDWEKASSKDEFNAQSLSYTRNIIKSVTGGTVSVKINGSDVNKEVGVLSVEKATDTKSYNLNGTQYVGYIKVDKVVPTIDNLKVYANQETKDTEYGSMPTGTTTWKCAKTVSEWVNNTVRITFQINVNKTWSNDMYYASGNYIYFTDAKPDAGKETVAIDDYKKWYRINPATDKIEEYKNGNWETITGSKDSIEKKAVLSNNTTGLDCYTTLTVKLTDSQNGTRYQFYVESGAGLKSTVYTVSDIQSDVNVPDISINMKETYERFSKVDGKYDNDAIATAYNGTDATTYNAKSTYTVKNSIIVKMSVGNIGYSGASVKMQYKGNSYVELENISYAQFTENKDELTGKMTVYYIVDQNGEYEVAFQVEENAVTNDKTAAEKVFADTHKHKEVSSNIKMDNSVPILTVKSFTYTKAKDWDYTTSDDRYYTAMAINFAIGYVEYSTESKKWIYHNQQSSYSDIHLKYSSDDGDTWDTEDIETGTSNIYSVTLQDGKAISYYFAVYSDAGYSSGKYPIEFSLGNILHSNKFTVTEDGNLYENIDEIYYEGVTYTTDFDGDNVVESAITKLQKALNGIMGHKIDGTTSASAFEYSGDIENYPFVFNIDTHVYTYLMKSKLLVGFDEQHNEVYDETSEFVEYQTMKGDWSNASGGVFAAVPVTEKHYHGDLMQFTYTTNTADGYYQIRTELNNKNLDFFGESNLFKEEEGTYQFKFYGGVDVNIYMYFGAELTVEYGDKLFYLQGKEKDAILSPTAVTSYSYNEGKKTVEPILSKEYYMMQDDNSFAQVKVTEKAGAYYITPYISLYSVANKTIDEALGTGYFEFVGEYVVSTDLKYAAGKDYYHYNDTTGKYEKFIPYVGSALTGTVYEYVEYKQTEDDKVKTGKTYYVRNNNGDFRVKVRDGDTTEKQYYAIQYFRPVYITENEVKKTYFYVNNEEEFSYMDDVYYQYRDDNSVTREWYYDVSDVTFRLQSNMTIGSDKVLHNVYKTAIDGNGKVLTLAKGESYLDVNKVSQRKYGSLIISDNFGLFETVAGTVKNLEIKLYEGSCTVESNKAISVGLFAQTIRETARLSNIVVSGDILVDINASSGTSYIGAFAAKVVSEDGSKKAVLGSQDDNAPIYVNTRISNQSAVDNVYVGALIGNAQDRIELDYVLVTQEITFVDCDEATVHVGSITGDNENNISISTDGLRYLLNDTFLNDEVVVSSLSGGLNYNDFVTTAYSGEVQVVGETVRNRLLSMIYKDFFGIAYSGVAGYGEGTELSPLQLTTVLYDDADNKKISNDLVEADYSVVKQIATMDKYMLLNYVWTESVDLTNFDTTIALHKVFTGSITTKYDETSREYIYVVLNNFGVKTDKNGNKITIETDDKVFGFFGHFNGKISNVVFRNVALDVNYTGTEALSFGIVAGETDSNTVMNNVIVIGQAKINATKAGAEIRAGAVSGYAYEGKIYDIFSMANLAVTATKISVGGIVGKIDKNGTMQLSNGSSGTIYALGRVEAKSSSKSGTGVQSVAGAVVGNGSFSLGATKTNVYGIVKNAYNLGVLEDSTVVGLGNYNEDHVEMVSFDNKDMRGTLLENEKSVFDVVFGTNGYYPLAGTGLSGDEFQVLNEEDFHNINLALYANYRIKNNITFTNFETIGEGLYFSGTIDGGDSNNIAADSEESSIVSLSNVTGPLVYHVLGTIKNIGVNLNCNIVVESGEEYYFGGIAVKAEGNLTNITVGGTVNIVGASKNTTAYVSGFVGVSYGGTISGNKSIINDISALSITVSNIGTVYFGGYAAEVSQGMSIFSYGLANGSVNIIDCTNVIAGLLVGQSHGECTWSMTLEVTYFYDIYITEDDLKKLVEKSSPEAKTKENPNGVINLYGRKNG